MRVVGGSARGRRLQAPPGRSLRPTSDRVREAVFNMLASRDAVVGSAVADLFAGTGALGVEALSRGAASVTFVDRDPRAVEAVRANLAITGLAERATVVRADALRWAESAPAVDLALVDPPYSFAAWPRLLEVLAARVAVLESDRELPAVPGWEVQRTARYGGTVVTLVQRTKGSS